jgi:hypothetical protein
MALLERVRAVVGSTPVPTTLQSTHPEVAKLLKEDDLRREKQAESSFYWDKPVFDTSIARRQLRIINGMFLALARLGYRSSIRGNGPFELHTQIGDSGVSWKLESTHKTVKASERSGDHLHLEIHSTHEIAHSLPTNWHDSAANRLENHRREMLQAIVLTGEYNYRAWITRQHEWRVKRRRDLEDAARHKIEEAERKRGAEFKRRQQAEVDKLLEDARRWRQAAEIRAYVDAQLATGRHETLAETSDWADWARSVADRIDPLSSAMK